MGFKEKVQNYYTKSYMKKYGDRITQLQGNIISVKIEEKAILWIFHKLVATILVKPDRSRGVVRCIYRRHRWFKKPEFMTLSQGNLVIIQGLKAAKQSDRKKKGKDTKLVGDAISVMNIRNLTTKKDLVKVEGNNSQPKTVRQVRRYK